MKYLLLKDLFDFYERIMLKPQLLFPTGLFAENRAQVDRGSK